MKTARFITLCVVLLSIFSYSEALAQHGRGHGRGHGHERWDDDDDDDRHRHHYRYDRDYYKKRHKHYKKQARYYEKHRRYDHYGYPRWARAHRYRARHHVYFRDYCTFYDPYRGGYVYWSSNRWIFTPNVPAFLANVDLGRARIQLMANIPLERHPEYYYDEYARAYPRSTNIHINLSLPPF
ncbi:MULTISPECIES: hypothetical protein [Olivibacter]|uniref:Uncharacterized protein n=2 Tax=Olivibacter TaxID=376469 RepID=A0ABV6HRP8_9SPHI|nr:MULTISPECIES: hypothetical protein [unclassified Olivibacter]MDM8174339.1 hypothetical protein [Olivibacter sp. 47]QEL04154.1 hypothetical protein FKG96_26105 [Olivibacter sp. LS-1]